VYFLEIVAILALDPGTLVLLLMVAGSVFIAEPKLRRFGTGILIAGTAALFAVLVLPIDHWVASPLEDRYARPPALTRVDGIVVLGGGLRPDILSSRGVPASEFSLDRLVAGADLAHRFPHARLVFSGGPYFVGGPTESGVARVIFRELAVPPRQAAFEERGRSTWEGLVLTRAMVRPKRGEVWVLVTSALHMPRALGVARKLGWTMVPWPSGYVTRGNGPAVINTRLEEKLLIIKWATHEWIGLIWYAIQGRTDALLP